jgi:hypothetical protein
MAGPPKDTYNHMYIVLCMFGMAMLFAYNCFIAAPDYVSNYYKYAAQDPDAVTEIPHVWKNMVEYIVVICMVPNFFGQAFVVSSYGQRLSLFGRMTIGCGFLTLSVVMVTVAPAFKVGEYTALAVLLGAVALSGAATSFFQSGVFALAAMLPARYTQGVMVGVGISGAVSGVLQMITKAVMSGSFEKQQAQGYMFFSIAIAWMLVCFVLTFVMVKSPFARYYLREYCGTVDDPVYEPLLQGKGDDGGDDDGAGDGINSDENDFGKQIEASLAIEASAHLSTLSGPGDSPTGYGEAWMVDDDGVSARPLRVILGITAPRLVANFLVYFFTLTVFPGLGVMADLTSGWFGIIIVFLFCLGDLCGRLLCRFPRLWVLPKRLLPMSVARVVFIPLFVLCVNPKVIPGRVFPCALMLLCGVTNGFTSSLCMMYSPMNPALRDSERGAIGCAMSLSLLGGCSAGSMVGLGVTTLLA